MEWDIFISYRRSDGRQLAEWLARKIRRFRLPGAVLAGLSSANSAVHERRPRVFLDTNVERASSDFLNKKILPALDETARLLVISTPSAFEAVIDHQGQPQQNWLTLEVEHFVGTGTVSSARPIDVVLGPGAPDDRFPGRLNENPHWDWIDLRRFSLWRRLLKPRQLDRALIRVIATLYDVEDRFHDALRQEAAKARRRIMIWTAACLSIIFFGSYSLIDRWRQASLTAAIDYAVREAVNFPERRMLLAAHVLQDSNDDETRSIARSLLWKVVERTSWWSVADVAAGSIRSLSWIEPESLVVGSEFDVRTHATEEIYRLQFRDVVQPRDSPILFNLGHAGDRVVSMRHDRPSGMTAVLTGEGRVLVIGRGQNDETHQSPIADYGPVIPQSTGIAWNCRAKPVEVMFGSHLNDTLMRWRVGGRSAPQSMWDLPLPLVDLDVDSSCTYVAALHNNGVASIWRLSDGKLIGQESTGGASLRWHPTRRLFATAGASEVALWRIEAGALPAVLGFHQNATAVAWSPDGDRLATTGDGIVTVWTVEFAEPPVLAFRGAPDRLSRDGEFSRRVSDRPLSAVAWSPSGNEIVVGDVDGYVKILRSEPSSHDWIFEGTARVEASATWNHVGRLERITRSDGVEVSAAELADFAYRYVGRRLTKDECTKHLGVACLFVASD